MAAILNKYAIFIIFTLLNDGLKIKIKKLTSNDMQLVYQFVPSRKVNAKYTVMPN